jgi:endonuclease/exonuclease/phosphatase family metal-dependent hydrolase
MNVGIAININSNKTRMVKVITINILFEMDVWMQRRELIVEGLAAQQPDLIGVQEVNIEENTGSWLAEQLDMPYVYLVPYQERPYKGGSAYGVAILSRHPFIQQAQLDLQSQGRLAQYVQVEVDSKPLVFCNGHYYWQPGSTSERIQQIHLLLNWLETLPPKIPVVAVGDFNATPETPEMILMREKFTSAYADYHGQEPDYTCPTPLIRQRKPWRAFVLRSLNFLVHRTLKPWRGTLDYIFINQHLSVDDCKLILTEPASNNKNIYPSDHFGIFADLQLTSV